MVNLRRRVMGLEEGDEKPKYSLKNGRRTMSSGKYGEVSNGNHIYQYGTVNGRALNYTDLTYGTTAHNNKPLWFTIPANSEVTLKLTFSTSVLPSATFYLRDINNVVVLSSGNIGTLDLSYIEVSTTLTEDTDVASFYLWMSKTTTDTFDVDVELYVEGERWI